MWRMCLRSHCDGKYFILKKNFPGQWLMSIIPGIQEVESERIEVQRQPGQKVSEKPV
jgi:hypothetical protein